MLEPRVQLVDARPASSVVAVVGSTEPPPAILYPEDGTLVPPNLAIDLHYTRGFDSVEISFRQGSELAVRAVLRNRPMMRTPWLVQVTPGLKGLLPFRVFYRMAALLRVNTSMMRWHGRR